MPTAFRSGFASHLPQVETCGYDSVTATPFLVSSLSSEDVSTPYRQKASGLRYQ